MDSIEELLLLFGGLFILAVALFYILPASTSIGEEFRGQAISQIILNSFDLMTPVIPSSANSITVYDSGFPTTLYVEISEYNASTNQLIPPIAGYKYPFHSGNNVLQLPSYPSNGNVYYEVNLYDPTKTVLYATYYVYKYVNNFVEINNILEDTKIFINSKQIYPTAVNNTVFLSLPNGIYNLTIYTPFYYYSNTISFPVSVPMIINIPTASQYATYTAYVDQMLPNGKLNILPGAVLNINDGTATYRTDSSGSVALKYAVGDSVFVNVSCPPTTCGSVISGTYATNNYTSLQGVFPISSFSQSTPFILYPKFRVVANLYITCNGTKYPTAGTISIIATPQNTTRNRYGTVNASGKFVSYMYAGVYNVSAISLSGLFNNTQINVTHYNQTFNLTFPYCVVHIPYNETIFYETGLPANTLWNVTYGGAINQSTTNKIIFTEIDTKVNYTYFIPNITINGYKYVPSPSSGASYTGKQINVNFVKEVPYVPITITNTQSTATPAPFQQMIEFNPSTYAQYENGNLGNIRFYQGSTELYSWCESGCSNTSSSAIFWIKLLNSVPANGNVIVNMTFEPKSVNYDGLYAGEAPQLAPTYGEYDNGASVFTFYDNFAGTIINNEWTQVVPSGTTITQNNGITITTDSSSTYGGLILTNGFSGVQIFEGDVTAVSGVAAGLALQTGNTASSGGIDFNYWSGSVAYGSMSGGMSGNNNPNLQISTGIMGGVWTSSSSQTWYKNYVATTGTQSAYTLPSVVYPSIGIYYSSPSTSITYQWVRVRAYPPNGVMPSTSFGSVKW